MNNSNFSIIDLILKVATYILLLLLLMAYISPYLSPKYVKIIPLIGLISPVIISLNIIAGAYWILKWNKIAILSVFMIIAGIGHISKFIQVPVSKDIHPKGSILKVLTFNTHYFTTPEYKDCLEESMKCIDSINSHIICFQEFPTNNKRITKEINKRLKKYPYRHINEAEGGNARTNYHTAIYSKFKIVNKGALNFKGTAKSFLLYSFRICGQTGVGAGCVVV